MKYANKLNAKNTIIIGDDELAKNEGNVKNMETREVTTISLDKIADCFKIKSCFLILVRDIFDKNHI